MKLSLENTLQQRRRMVYMAIQSWKSDKCKYKSLSEICDMTKPIVLNNPKIQHSQKFEKIV